MAAFEHRQSAHCESGVVANLLTNQGLAISEPMAFGLSSSMAFAYLPMVKLAGMPLIAYRMPPGNVIKGSEKRLRMRWVRRSFSNAQAGMDALDAELANGNAVGLQTCVYWLPYFPEHMRFHFNAHNLVVIRREGDDYLISDPIFEEITRCDAASLRKARFAKGAMASNGMMYHPTQLPAAVDYERAIPAAIRWNRKIMTATPAPVIGINGIRYLGRNIAKLGKSNKRETYLPRYLGHIVRMQEEIGTGGAGFRFLYSSFLQEAGKRLDKPVLRSAAEAMTEAGDEWRRFALQATRMCRDRTPMDTEALAGILDRIADQERAAWTMLKEV